MENTVNGENREMATIPFAVPPVITINEVDADTPGTDIAEFVELYDGGVGNTPLDGLVVVFFNGADDKSYAAFDLDGFTTDANGFFVLGNAATPNVALIFPNNTLQNGADAVALYQGHAVDFPNGTLATTTNLLDALVYDTADADDNGLLVALGQATQFDEAANNQSANESNSRIPDGTGHFVAQSPTPGAANAIDANAAPTSSSVSISLEEDVIYTFSVGDFPFADTDSGDTLQAIRITQAPARGQLFIDENSNNTQDFGEAVGTEEIAVTDLAKLKFAPTANGNGKPYTSFQFQVSDGEDFSTEASTFTFNITPMNDAPVLSGTPLFPDINEDVPNALNPGTTVADLIAGLITDADFDPQGLAITGVDNTNGTWQYSINGGTTWQGISSATTDNNAVVLGATSLYSGYLGTAPASQNWLAFANVTGATQTVGTTGTTLNTMASQNIYAGYSNFNGPVLVNPNFPSLDNTTGYRISFNLQLLEEARTNANRAGFSIIAVSQDKTKAIELGFQKLSATTGNIFAQGSSPLFVAAENVSFNTTQATQYTLAVKDNSYTLLANGVQVLTGALRDYSAFSGPIDPYETPNFIFLGDDTTSARGSFVLSQVAVETETRLRFVPNADYNGSSTITVRAWDTTDGSYNSETGLDASQNGGTTAFSATASTAMLTITPVNDAPTGNVTLTGTAQVGKTLTVNTSTLADVDGLGDFSFEWQQSANGLTSWETIAGVNGSALTLTQNQVGDYVRSVVSYTDGDNTVETVFGVPTASPVEPVYWPNFVGDGSADIVWHHHQAGQNVIWEMEGTELESGLLIQSVDQGWDLRAIGDFNQDDNPDLVWRHDLSGQTVLWLMDGADVSEGIVLDTVDPTWQIEAAADFNQDGEVDIFWRHKLSGQNVVWLMEGTERTGVMWLETVASPDWEVGAVGDFTQDGNLEVLWRHRTAGVNVVWFLEGNEIVDTTTLSPVDAGWSMVGAADFTQDGNLDILWRHRTAGANVVWAMEGLALQDGLLLPEVGPEWMAVI
jgi:hypothetical protein